MANDYKYAKLNRCDGILEITLHTNDGPFQWNLDAQVELASVFAAVGCDRNNRVIILTGTGTEFSGPRLDPAAHFFHETPLTPSGVHHVFRNAKQLVYSLLDVEVPMIAAVNGPAMRHADLVLTCDIVLATEDASFEDTAHFHNGSIVPGDGINVVFTMLMGLNRARYLMLTGQVLTAKEAKEIGMVAELVSRDKILQRAWELAEQLAKKPDMLLRYTRKVLTHPLRKALDDGLQYYLAMEALSTLNKRDT